MVQVGNQLVVQAGNQLVVQVGNQLVQVGKSCVHYITLLIIQLIIHICCQLINNL